MVARVNADSGWWSGAEAGASKFKLVFFFWLMVAVAMMAHLVTINLNSNLLSKSYLASLDPQPASPRMRFLGIVLS